jgi:hypothetical protein
MRTIAVAAILFAALSLSSGARADGTWCAHYVLHTNCGFYSYEQCEAARSGNGGFAREIHSQRMALRGNRKGVFGATISKPDCPISKPQTARPMQGFPMH